MAGETVEVMLVVAPVTVAVPVVHPPARRVVPEMVTDPVKIPVEDGHVEAIVQIGELFCFATTGPPLPPSPYCSNPVETPETHVPE